MYYYFWIYLYVLIKVALVTVDNQGPKFQEYVLIF